MPPVFFPPNTTPTQQLLALLSQQQQLQSQLAQVQTALAAFAGYAIGLDPTGTVLTVTPAPTQQSAQAQNSQGS